VYTTLVNIYGTSKWYREASEYLDQMTEQGFITTFHECVILFSSSLCYRSALLIAFVLESVPFLHRRCHPVYAGVSYGFFV
jgi:pentatricopeptide repeat protein